MTEVFSTLNPYSSLQVIVASDPQSLVEELLSIKTPITIVAITNVGVKQAAYIMGDIRLKKQRNKKLKENTDGNGNSSGA